MYIMLIYILSLPVKSARRVVSGLVRLEFHKDRPSHERVRVWVWGWERKHS